jgi:hypothetical protein
MIITDVLGNCYTVTSISPDGSWNCPCCWAAASGWCHHDAKCSGQHCTNPACVANPHVPAEWALEQIAKAERRKAEEAERLENVRIRREYAEQAARERAEAKEQIRAEAVKRGACVRCALKDAPYRVKYVKHRAKCPLV